MTVYQAPKDEAPAMTDSLGDPALNNPQQTNRSLTWKVPSGWKETSGSGMRVATLVPPAGKGQTELSVVQLSGDAGGDLPNVNRWRGQLGLPPIDSLAGQTQTLGTPVGKTLVVDIKGDNDRAMVAAILRDGDASWFFKLTGPVAAVAEAKPAFIFYVFSSLFALRDLPPGPDPHTFAQAGLLPAVDQHAISAHSFQFGKIFKTLKVVGGYGLADFHLDCGESSPEIQKHIDLMSGPVAPVVKRGPLATMDKSLEYLRYYESFIDTPIQRMPHEIFSAPDSQ